MGQLVTSPPAEKLPTPPDVIAYNRRRQDYIHRLGIQRDGKSMVNVPQTHIESPGKVCEKSRWKSMSTMSSMSTCAESREGAENEDAETVSSNGPDLNNADHFRVNFLRRLSQEKIWLPKPQRPPSHQTVIIFDWDDTLLCTSYLNEKVHDGYPAPAGTEKLLRSIAQGAQQLLEMSLRLGQTFIITNAASMWVQYSCAKWIPELLPTLEKVRVISARSKHEDEYPHQVSQWKIQAFLDVQRQMDSQIIANLVSLGDSQFEMDATHVMGKEFATALIKTVKFHQHPCPEALLKQLHLVLPKFERIVENARNMKIGLEKKGPEHH
jgi:hypothetical protein